MQKYTFFLNGQCFRFVKWGEETLNLVAETKTIKWDSAFSFQEIVKKLESKMIFFLCDEPEKAWQEFTEQFTIIEAAGGLVVNPKEELLCIFRNGKWDLPKGKVESGEDFSEAALREVEEECGVSDLTVQLFFAETYHVYWLNNQYVLKRTHWYKMFCKSYEKLVPQQEEGITNVCWKNKTALQGVFENTYPNIKLLLEMYLKE